MCGRARLSSDVSEIKLVSRSYRIGQLRTSALLALLIDDCQTPSQGARNRGGLAMRTITMRVRAVDFAERIAAMRIWLDEHRIEPSKFKYSEDGNDLLIDVSFEVADEAAAFSARFNGESTEPP